MRIVIDIPDKQYELIKKSDYNAFSVMVSKECMMYAIKTGTPLPKGHGRLIDESDIEWAKFKSKYSEDDELVNWEDIEDAPTIIPADREESE